jgi:hypothetical protein
LAFSYENPFCMGLLYGRAGRLTAFFGGFGPGSGLTCGPKCFDGRKCFCLNVAEAIAMTNAGMPAAPAPSMHDMER